MKRYASLAVVIVAALFTIGLVNRTVADDAKPVNSGKSTADLAQETVDKALAFLKTKQKPDGSWNSELEPPGLSALVLRGFAQEPKTAKEDFIKKGFDKLLSNQQDDGGIYKEQMANYSTAISISALAAADNPQYKARIEKAVSYLKSLQWSDKIAGANGQKITVPPSDPRFGGTGYETGRPDGSNTTMMLQALHDAGVDKDDPAFKNAMTFISRMQNNSETNDQRAGFTPGNDGGMFYSPANNGESKAGEYVGEGGKRMLRSYGSMTYAGLKSMIYAGVSKDDPRVKAAWKWITENYTVDENPGMRLNDPKNAQWGLNYYLHTMALALHAYGQPVIEDAQRNKHDWREDIVKKIAAMQKEDGSFVGERKWLEDNPVLTTAYIVMALQEVQKDLKEHPVGK